MTEISGNFLVPPPSDREGFFMTKDPRTHSTRTLRRKQSLHDHGGEPGPRTRPDVTRERKCITSIAAERHAPHDHWRDRKPFRAEKCISGRYVHRARCCCQLRGE